MSVEKTSRRDFIGLSFCAVAAVGAGFGLFAMKRTWDPLPSVQAEKTTTVDVSSMKDGELHQVTWQKKPVFILKKSSDMKADDKRDSIIGDSRFTIVIGLCTHLGCIPGWKASQGEFVCACHGGTFNSSGVNVFGPPPRPLDIPPFQINDTTLVLGEEGPEYKKLMGLA